VAKRRITALDIGGSNLRLAEFEGSAATGLQLVSYEITSMAMQPGGDAEASAYIVSAIRDIMRTRGIKPGPVLLSIAGKDIFPRYVKLPPVGKEKVGQMVQYEAQQNVPFPIDEVVWDYQLVEADEGGQSVMIVAVKTDVVNKVTDCVVAAGLEPSIVDVAPMALYNLARFNYGKLDDCVLLMDMGARTTSLIFMEQNRIFCRSIPIAGNTITQELMKEFDLPFTDAEELKHAHAFVAFGGVVEEAKSQVVNRVSKTVRSIMTRLHAEVSRSINFYRSQQRGSSPSLVLLAGGSSVIPQTDTFFTEKLGVQVDYINPFQNISVSDSIAAEEVSQKTHLLGEVAGLALRPVYSCPMELNLMPPVLVAKKVLRGRIPFFVVAVASVVIISLCWWGFFARLRSLEGASLRKVDERVAVIDAVKAELMTNMEVEAGFRTKTDRLLQLIQLRTRWIQMLRDIHSRVLDGMWLTRISALREGDRPEMPITHIEIKGMGFRDKVESAQAVETFSAVIAEGKYFSDDVEVYRVASPEAYALEFVIRIGLKEPLTFRDP
jgi:type IV pilus assembly protein PilM